MNEDAEKWIYANYGIPESGIGMDVALMEQLLQAMRWAYADCCRIAREESDETGETIASLIESRMK